MKNVNLVNSLKYGYIIVNPYKEVINMRKRGYVAFGLGVAGAMGLSTILSNKNQRNRIMNMYVTSKEAVVEWLCREKPEQCKDVIEKAGNPDPYDIPDNKMVDEGAMYSVHFYNKKEQQS